MIASSSPGFEGFSAPFLKYAYPGDEKDKNVTVPTWPTSFTLL
jgi:hypothetical protein